MFVRLCSVLMKVMLVQQIIIALAGSAVTSSAFLQPFSCFTRDHTIAILQKQKPNDWLNTWHLRSSSNRINERTLRYNLHLSDANMPLVEIGNPVSGNHASDVVVFVLGVIPFIWATIEFWRRIALQLPFGTGADSVVIGEDDKPSSSRGRRTLGRGAIIVAYILFGLASSVLIITLVSVVSSPQAPTY